MTEAKCEIISWTLRKSAKLLFLRYPHVYRSMVNPPSNFRFCNTPTNIYCIKTNWYFCQQIMYRGE